MDQSNTLHLRAESRPAISSRLATFIATVLMVGVLAAAAAGLAQMRNIPPVLIDDPMTAQFGVG